MATEKGKEAEKNKLDVVNGTKDVKSKLAKTESQEHNMKDTTSKDEAQASKTLIINETSEQSKEATQVESSETMVDNNQVAEESSSDNTPKVESIEVKQEDTRQKCNAPMEIKSIQNHYKIHTKSTLPHILTKYGFEDKDHQQPKSIKRRKKKHEQMRVTETDDDDRDRRNAQEEKFRSQFGDTRQTGTYYLEYLDSLENKVMQQHLKAKKERMEAERRTEDEHQRNIFVRRLERVQLTHDDSFMKDLPKTDIARIVALQDRMRKEGKLRNQSDVDKFWTDIRKPQMFYERFKVKMKDQGLEQFPQTGRENKCNNAGKFENDDDSYSDDDNVSDTDDLDMGLRSLSHISEASKDQESWAITQKFQSSHGPKSSKERKKKYSMQVAKEAPLDIEKQCPKLIMPTLSCFHLKLGQEPPDFEARKRSSELKAREKERKKHHRKLVYMYQMAMANSAAANRLMVAHSDLTDILEGAALRDVIAVFDEPYRRLDDHRTADHSAVLQVYPGVDRMSEDNHGQPSTRHSSAGSRKLKQLSDAGSRPASKSQRKKKSAKKLEYTLPLPLSFEEVYTKEKTLEPSCTSSLWPNYMRVGKSAFAQT